MLNIFHVLISYFYILFSVYLNLPHILKLRCLSFYEWAVRDFHICSGYNILLGICFTNIFSHFMCVFVISWYVLRCTEVLVLMIFFLLLLVFSKTLLPNLRSWKFIPKFFSKGFIVLAITFRSSIYFELVWYMVWSRDPNSFFCLWISSFHSTICWKDCSVSLNGLGILVKS